MNDCRALKCYCQFVTNKKIKIKLRTCTAVWSSGPHCMSPTLHPPTRHIKPARLGTFYMSGCLLLHPSLTNTRWQGIIPCNKEGFPLSVTSIWVYWTRWRGETLSVVSKGFIGCNEGGNPPCRLSLAWNVRQRSTTSPTFSCFEWGEVSATHHPSLLMFQCDGGDSRPSLPLHCVKVWDRGHLRLTTPHLAFWCNRGDFQPPPTPHCVETWDGGLLCPAPSLHRPSIASKCEMVSPVLHFDVIEGVLSFPTPLSSRNTV